MLCRERASARLVVNAMYTGRCNVMYSIIALMNDDNTHIELLRGLMVLIKILLISVRGEK